MFKKLFLIALLIPSVVLADVPGIVNSTQSTLHRDQGETGQVSMDLKSQLILSPLSVITVVPSTPSALTANGPATVTVGVASGVAVAANALRKGLVLVNTHATNYLCLAAATPAILGSGICLFPNGGSWTMNPQTFTTQEIRAIASGASTNLSVQEFQ